MLVEHPGTRSYLFSALQGTPDIIDELLKGLTEEEADFRLDPERFSIREVMAHLADWEGIFLHRLQRTRDENEPLLEDYDQEKLACDRNYAQSLWPDQSRRFRERRTQTLRFLDNLTPPHWERCCVHPRVGRLTLEALVLLILLHDAYHTRQLAQWRRGYAEQA